MFYKLKKMQKVVYPGTKPPYFKIGSISCRDTEKHCFQLIQLGEEQY